jgi:hypothetical protein
MPSHRLSIRLRAPPREFARRPTGCLPDNEQCVCLPGEGELAKKRSAWFRKGLGGFKSNSLRQPVCDVRDSPEKPAKFARVRGYLPMPPNTSYAPPHKLRLRLLLGRALVWCPGDSMNKKGPNCGVFRPI